VETYIGVTKQVLNVPYIAFGHVAIEGNAFAEDHAGWGWGTVRKDGKRGEGEGEEGGCQQSELHFG
jgi:hypothetical protein